MCGVINIIKIIKRLKLYGICHKVIYVKESNQSTSNKKQSILRDHGSPLHSSALCLLILLISCVLTELFWSTLVFAFIRFLESILLLVLHVIP